MAPGRRKMRNEPGGSPPEWFYPLARLIHQRVAEVVGEEPPLPGMEPEGFFRNPVSSDKLEGFTMVGERAGNVYMRGIVWVHDDLFFRYAKRAPKRRFLEFFNQGVESVTPITDR